MRILMINKFLYPNGGSETYIFKLGEVLEQRDHEVQYFGMEHEGRCVGNRVNAYVIRTKNQNDLMQSTSGGFSTPLAQWFFSKGGSVWTASYDNNWNVVHREFTKDDVDFSKTRGSKYVQSYLGDMGKRKKAVISLILCILSFKRICMLVAISFFVLSKWLIQKKPVSKKMVFATVIIFVLLPTLTCR